jgi:arylsulfatase A
MILSGLLLSLAPQAPERTNVVVILADDLGYGDVHAYAPDSRLETPAFDRIAAEGLRFTDAHSPSAVCSPTRYALLTGRYAWRTRLQSGVLGPYDPPLIAPGEATLGTLLRSAGYRTAAIGKWHLGLALPMRAEHDETSTWEGDPGVDFAGRIADGPTHHGFERYFGVAASLDMPPYVFVEDDRFRELPTVRQPQQPFPHFVREGPRSLDFRLDSALDDLTREAVAFLEEAAEGEAPFFLYFPLTAPHKPTLPHEHFRGRTGLGEYGDLVAQVDWTVGRVLRALDEAGVAEETLLVVTSDNGSYMYRREDPTRDHVSDPANQGYHPDHHRPNGELRGTKADIYEAGHRVPFLVRWPGRVPAGEVCAETVCHVDLFATLVELLDLELPAGAAPDSRSLAALLADPGEARRGAPVVHHSINGTFALREGRWKAIFSTGSGGRERPRGAPFDGVRLFDLEADPGETRDLAAGHPELVERMTAELERIRAE